MAGGVLSDSPSLVMSAIVEGAYTAIEAGNAELNGQCCFDRNEGKFVWLTGQLPDSGAEVTACGYMGSSSGGEEVVDTTATTIKQFRTGAYTAIEAGNAELNETQCCFDRNEGKFVWLTGQLPDSGAEVTACGYMGSSSGGEEVVDTTATTIKQFRTVAELPADKKGDEKALTVKIASPKYILNGITKAFQDYIEEKKTNAVGDREKLERLAQFEYEGLSLIYQQSVVDDCMGSSSPLVMLEHIRTFLSTSAQASGPQVSDIAEAGLLADPVVGKKGRVTAQCNSIMGLTELYYFVVTGKAKDLRITEERGGGYQVKYTPISDANGEVRSLTEQESKRFKKALIGLMETHKSGTVERQKEQVTLALNLGRKLGFNERPKQIDRAGWRSKPYAEEAKEVLSVLFAFVNEKKSLSVGQAIGLTQYLSLVNEFIKPPNDTDITAKLVLESRPELQLTCQSRRQRQSHIVRLPLEGIDVATARDSVERQDSENPLVVLHTEILKGRLDAEMQSSIRDLPPLDGWVKSELALATDKSRGATIYKERYEKAAGYLKDTRLNNDTFVEVKEKPGDNGILVVKFNLGSVVADGSEESVIELEFSNRIASNGEMRADNLKQALETTVYGSLEELFKSKYLSASDPTISGALNAFMSRLTEDDLAGLNKAERKTVFENLKGLPISTVKNMPFASKPDLTYGDVFAVVPPLWRKESEMTARPDCITKNKWSKIIGICRTNSGGETDDSDALYLGQQLENSKINDTDQMISAEDGARLASNLSRDGGLKYINLIPHKEDEGNGKVYTQLFIGKKVGDDGHTPSNYPLEKIAKFPGELVGDDRSLLSGARGPQAPSPKPS